MKRASVCIFSAILVFASLVLISFPSTASQPPEPDSNIKVIDYNWYLESTGTLVAVGVAQNTGPYTYRNITLAGTVFTQDDATVYSYTVVWVSNLLPNQKAPFYMQFDPRDTFYGSFIGVEISKIDFIAYPSEKTQNYLYPEVIVQNSDGWIDTDGAFYVSGTVKNTGTQDAKDVIIVATFYNKAGKIVSVGNTGIPITPNPIPPEGTANFKVGAWDLNQNLIDEQYKIASSSVLVQVSGTVLHGDAPVVTPNPTAGVTSGNPQPTAPPSGNLSNTYIIIIIVVIAAVAIIAILFQIHQRGSAKTKPTKSSNAKPKKHKQH